MEMREAWPDTSDEDIDINSNLNPLKKLTSSSRLHTAKQEVCFQFTALKTFLQATKSKNS